LDVGDVDFVDDTVDTFPEELPHDFLVIDTASTLFEQFLLHGSETMRRHVDASRSGRSCGVFGFEFFIVFLSDEVWSLLESLNERGILVLLLGDVVD
jgi:hypothetical protein